MSGMLLFWIAAALLIIVSAALVLAPLRGPGRLRSRSESDVAVYRDQLDEVEQDLKRGLIGDAEAAAARTEISRRLLAADAARDAEKGTRTRAGTSFALIMVAAVPVLAVLFYLHGGAPGLPAQPFEARISKPPEEQNIEELVARVEQHLRANPEDADGWRVVAPIYARMGRFEDAADAYGRLVDIEGPSAELLASLGEALVFADEGLVGERTVAIFERALSLDPTLPQARYFLGLAAVQEGDTDEARAIWATLASDFGESSQWGQMALRSLAALDQPAVEATPGPAPAQAPATGPASEAGQAIAELPPEERAAAIEAMVDNLDARLDAEGGEVDQWLRLMRARAVLQQEEQATDVLTRALSAFEGDEAARDRLLTEADALGLAPSED